MFTAVFQFDNSAGTASDMANIALNGIPSITFAAVGTLTSSIMSNSTVHRRERMPIAGGGAVSPCPQGVTLANLVGMRWRTAATLHGAACMLWMPRP